MKSLTKTRQSIWFAVLVFLAGRVPPVFANPTGLRVASGSAFAQQLGSQLNVTVSQTAVLNWSSFNLAAGETTSFLQPSANSVVLNVIGGANPSQIFGRLNANGTVILENANGFYFGPDSMIKVGGSFIATTAPLIPDFGAGSSWQFSGMPPLASIVNYGQIEVGQGRSLFLIAEKIENHGSLTAPGGNIELAAGQSVLVSDSPDGRGLSATVTLPSGSVDNFGRVTADAGTIALEAKVVNQNGILQANSVQNQNGVIELVASDTVNLGANSQILAQGDGSAGGSAGGKVTIKSDNTFSDTAGSTISTAGGANGGNGGNVEISAPNVASLNSTMDATAQAGWTGGTFFLDPVNIILGTSTTGGAINVNTAFAGFSSIDLQASGNITLNQNTVWNLSGCTGQTAGQLTLQAGGDITFGNSSKITDANGWSVTLEAGYNFGNHTINSGTGNIYLNGGSGKSQNGTIQLAAGSVNLYAGQSILVGFGSVFTTGGGSIFAYALAGDINAGTSNGGTSSTSQTTDYNFTDSGSTPNPFLGGISTAAGGNVTLIAGNNIDSTPKVPSKQAPGASGTYGFGNVTVIAGSQITGNYTLADGVGTMIAGVPVSSAQAAVLQNPTANPAAYAGTLNDLVTAVQSSPNVNGYIGAAPVAGNPSISPVTFSVINGSWNVWAANDISVKEVNNPNGAFNVAQSFLFNYAPDASASFWAGNAIELTGANLGRLTSVNRTPIYAPTLSLNAGAGGIKIDKSIILAPSSQGSLNIITRDGGNLSGAVTAGSTVLNGITMSDSGSTDYTTYAAEHDNIHLHDANPQPVRLDISGSIGSFGLTVPTFANITVEGTKPFIDPDGNNVYGTFNFGFKGRNLSPDQTTSINVLGTITYRGDLTTVDLTAAQLADPLPAALFANSADPSVTAKLRYDATTGKLIYVGVMSASDLAFLLAPSVIVLDRNGKPVTAPLLDENGKPVLDANGNPVTVPVTAPLTLDTTQQGMINQLYAASQSASLGDQGLALAGPGNFDVTANRIDLGVSGGIRVIAPNAGLAAISPYGANLNVTTVGDLSMTSTKIANESYLGDVTLNVGGTLDVGGQFTTLGDPNAAKGIFTTSGGNVSVIANGDVNVNGSRIAAYDGGNLTVLSLTGDVNAGVGGAGYVSLTALELNPLTGLLVSIPASIPGSGILATTVVGSHAALGNILVETPNGNISASQGGVLQISFNGTDASQATAELLAGYELQDAGGQPVLAQNLNLGTTVRISDNRNIDASGSGIIAQNVIVKATGKVDGLFVGFSSVNLDAGSFGNGIAFGPTVTISGPSDAGGIPIQVITDNPSTVNGVSVAPTASDAPSAPKEVAETTEAASTIAKSSGDNDENDDPTKKKKGIALAQKVSRVTVLLPKRVSEKAGVGNPL
jgi:filamentous hemagglutinin family protein